MFVSLRLCVVVLRNKDLQLPSKFRLLETSCIFRANVRVCFWAGAQQKLQKGMCTTKYEISLYVCIIWAVIAWKLWIYLYLPTQYQADWSVWLCRVSWILAGPKFCCALVQFVFSMFQVTKYESSCSVYVTSVYSLPSGISLSCSVCSCKYQMSHNTQKRVFRDFQPGKIQTSLLSYRSLLESWNLGYNKYTYHTI